MKPSVTIQHVAQWELPLVWPVASGLLELALEKEGYGTEISSILNLLETQHMQLWLALLEGTIVAAVATEVVKYPKVLVARMVLAGGTQGSKWEGHLAKEFEFWARKKGIDIVEVQGRPGWGKRMKKYGMKLHSVTLQVNLRTIH